MSSLSHASACIINSAVVNNLRLSDMYYMFNELYPTGIPLHPAPLTHHSMDKRVLITGASGLLGRAVMREFERDGSWGVLGLAFSRAGDKLRKVDITDKQAVFSIMQEFKVQIRESRCNLHPSCV